MERYGRLTMPAIVAAYSAYMIYEQLTGEYRESSRNYSILIGGIAVFFALMAIARTLGELNTLPATVKTLDPAVRQRYVQIGAITALMIFSVLAMTTLGYVICFLSLLVLSLLILGIRSTPQILGISLVVVALVHFGLVRGLELPLPAGILAGVI